MTHYKSVFLSMFFIWSLLTACSGGGGGGGGATVSGFPSVAPTPDANGQLTSTIQPNSASTISASALTGGNPLSALTTVDFPSGSVGQATDVKIYETASIASKIDASSVGVDSLTSNGPAMVISGDDSALKLDITVHIPYDSSVLTTLRLAATSATVGVLGIFSDGTAQIFTGSDINKEDKVIDVQTRHFGVYQAIQLAGTVQNAKITTKIDINKLTPVGETSSTTDKTSAPAATTSPVYHVTYDGNGNSSGSVPADATGYSSGQTITVLSNSGTLGKSGYSFAGWNTQADGAGTTYSQGQTFTIASSNITLYAKWTANPTFTISYNGNGSTGGSVPTDSTSYESGQTVTVAGNTGSLLKTGFSFTGWNIAANGSGTAYVQSQTFAIGSANVTLYAQWTSNSTYSITYNGNGSTGGSVPTDSTNYQSGQSATVLGNTGNLIKSGYAFSGWNTSANGSGTTYTQAQTFAMSSTNVTLYAQWTLIPTYTITYAGNGNTSGSVPTDSTAYQAAQTVTVLGNSGNLARTGYTFSGWNTLANGNGTSCTQSQTFDMQSGNITLYAKWIPIYVIIYSGNGNTGGNAPTDSNNYQLGQSIAVLGNTGNLVKNSFVFSGWNTSTDGTGTTYGQGQTFNIGAANVTLYARWVSGPTYNVTYVGNGNTTGSAPTDFTNYQTGQSVTVLGNSGNLLKAGYSFVGWNTALDGGGTTYSQTQTFSMPSTNITLYAKWTNNPTYGVTYVGNGNTGGNVPTDPTNYQTGQVGAVLGNSGNLIKSGYSFVGWSTAANGSGTTYIQSQTFTMGTANVTLYAKWIAGSTYSVTYVGNGGTLGSVPTDANNYQAGQLVTVLGNSGSLVKSNYSFSGWNTAADGSGATYTPSQTFSMGTANVTLYVQWTANPSMLFQACVDGSDILTVNNGQLSITHRNWDPIGKHSACPQGYLDQNNGYFKINGSPYHLADLPLNVPISKIGGFQVIYGRGGVTLRNGGSVLINDDPEGGPYVYTIEFYQNALPTTVITNTPVLNSISVQEQSAFGTDANANLLFDVTSGITYASAMIFSDTDCQKCIWGGPWTYGAAFPMTMTSASFSVEVVDIVGNQSNCLQKTLNNIVDFIINDGSDYATSQSVTLNFTAPNTVKDMYITNTAGCTGGSWETFSQTKAWTLPNANAANTVYVKYRNTSLAESSCLSRTITHDSIPPVINSIAVQENAAFGINANANLVFSVTEVNDYWIEISNGPDCDHPDAGNYGDSVVPWTLVSKTGSTDIFVRVTDAVGNQSSCIKKTFNNIVDFIINDGSDYTTSQSVTLNFTAPNTVKDMYITNTAGCTGGSWETFSQTKAWTLPNANAANTVYVKYRNTSLAESSCLSRTMTHDNIPPTISAFSITGDDGSTTLLSKDASLQISCTSSEYAQYYVTNTAGCSSGGQWQDGCQGQFGNRSQWAMAMPPQGASGGGSYQPNPVNGVATIYVKIKDLAGNESSCISKTLYVPSISINGGATSTQSASATLTLISANADQMYITNTQGCSSGGVWQSYTGNPSWTLPSSPSGTYTVYAKFKTAEGVESPCISSKIESLFWSLPTNSTGYHNIADNNVRGVYVYGSTIYAATEGGLSISADAGSTWTNRTTSNGLGANNVNGVYVTSSAIYAATENGLSVSTDGGVSFTDGLSGIEVKGVYVNDANIYAATWNGGLLISKDNGVSFSRKTVNDGLPDAGNGNTALYGVYASGTSVYVAGRGGVSISTNSGVSFTCKTTANGLGDNEVSSVYVSGSNIYAGTWNHEMYISTDGGESFTAAPDGYYTNGSNTYVSGSTVYTGTGQGLGISTDGGADFTYITAANSIGSSEISDIFVSGSTIYAASWYGDIAISTNGGASFNIKHVGGGLTRVFVSGSTIYVATYGSGVAKSVDGGDNFTFSTTGLGDNVVLDVVANGQNVYAATAGGLSISTDGGATFTNKTKTDGLGDNRVNKVFVVGSVIYAATDGGLSKSTNAGGSFINSTFSDNNNQVTSVYVSGSNVYAGTYAGFAVSTDGGESFTISQEKYNQPYASKGIYVSGSNIYVASFGGGLYISTDGGSSWIRKTTVDGLAGDAVYNVYVSGSTVYAATRGGISALYPVIQVH